MSAVTVSVVLATYDGARHLPTQLASIAAQTRQPDELVVRDDCSSDDTLAVLAAFADAAPFPVRIEQNRRRIGYAQNFGRAMAAATGEVLALCDQDDVWEPTKLAHCVALFDDAAVDLVVHDLATIDGAGRHLGAARDLRASEPGFVKGCATVVRRGFAVACLPVPEGAGHDEWLHWMAARLGTRHVHGEVLADYRLHADNASGQMPTKRGRLGTLAHRISAAAATPAADLRAAAARRRATAQACSRLAATEMRPDVREEARAAARADLRAAVELDVWAGIRTRSRLWALAWRAWRHVGPGSDARPHGM